MIDYIMRVIVHSPLYPHWLEHYKMRQGDDEILRNLQGDVLEVGAGDGTKKQRILETHPKITSYTATDYSSWDDEFESFSAIPNRFGSAGAIFMGRGHRVKLDNVCSATDLPYKDKSFDAHLSFEVLEHIDDPEAYFREAARVIKPKGKIIISVPFLYREHKMDFHRYTPDYFAYVAKKNNLRVKKFYHNTGFGTTQTVLANQWFVRRTLESSILFRPFLLFLSPLVFIYNNTIGYLIDLRPDRRFATRFHVEFEKIK